MTFAGAHTALVTPFRDGQFDVQAFRQLIEEQIAGGISGIVPVGTTGESPTLDHDEHLKVVETAVQTANKRCLVIAGTGSNATGEAISLTRAAEKASREADAANIEATRAAAAAMAEAEAAQRASMAANKDTVKGLRTVTRYEITDHRALLNFIAKQARDDVTAFIEEWARKNHKAFAHADGLRVWQQKEAR